MIRDHSQLRRLFSQAIPGEIALKVVYGVEGSQIAVLAVTHCQNFHLISVLVCASRRHFSFHFLIGREENGAF